MKLLNEEHNSINSEIHAAILSYRSFSISFYIFHLITFNSSNNLRKHKKSYHFSCGRILQLLLQDYYDHILPKLRNLSIFLLLTRESRNFFIHEKNVGHREL